MAKIYIQKHYITAQPAQQVIPIITSFEYNIKNTQLHYILGQPSKPVVPVPDENSPSKGQTHSPPPVKSNIKTPKRNRNTAKPAIMTNIISRNSCRQTQIKTQKGEN